MSISGKSTIMYLLYIIVSSFTKISSIIKKIYLYAAPTFVRLLHALEV